MSNNNMRGTAENTGRR
jgi:hypothetical protein